MYEVGVARDFEARHELAGDVGGPAEEHGHDYRAEVVARGERLDEAGMLLDLDVLAGALAECLAELESADLDALPAFAGENTTVEVVATHIWERVRDRLTASPGLASLRVTVRESPDAWATVDRPLAT